MSNILDIHIHRVAAGQTIPFDKVYLIMPEDKELVPKIFGYGIVLPLSEAIKDAIYQLRPASITRKHFRRNDDHKKIPATIADEPINGHKHNEAQVRQWWVEFAAEVQLEKRLVVIPVLTSVARKKIRPRYLANQKWFASNSQKNKKQRKNLPVVNDIVAPLSEFAYLATPLADPFDKIRPLCSICPRMLRHIQGECVPGQPICYESLNFADIGGESDDASVQSDHD